MTNRLAAVLRWAAIVRAATGVSARANALLRPRLALGAAVLLMLVVHASGAARPLDNLLSDLRAQLLQRPSTGQLVVVEIDARSLRDAEEWPWPRSSFARAVANLRRAGAGLIAFDVDFSARSSSHEDEALRRAVEIDPGTVVLPTFLQQSGEENTPLASLSEDAVLGSVNILVDSDGRARRYNRGFRVGERYYASMSAVLAGEPYGDSSQFFIDYGIDPDTIAHLSFRDVIAGTFDPELVHGKTILIGATALELGDKFSTPVSPAMPGVYVHALAYESLMLGRALTGLRPEWALALALVVLAVLWPVRRKARLQRLVLRHALILPALVGAPILLQAVAPVRADLALVLIAQVICLLVGLRRELDHRAAELVRQREAHLDYIAHHDAETLLPNRRAMLNALSTAVRAASENAIAVCAIGIDRFSILRGAIGYGNANKIVALLAKRIVGEGADVYHVSSSILGVIGCFEDVEAARAFCERCASIASSDFVVGDAEIEVGLRVGAAILPRGGSCDDKLLEQASLALDRARAEKRRIVYHVDGDADPRIQLAIISDVRRGLARGEFRLVYQPKVSASGWAITGSEALLRWAHPVHGEIPPDVFVGAAEDTGAIHELTIWALRRAIQDQRTLKLNGLDVQTSVNLSARTLTDQNFCRAAITMVTTAKANICFEITETAVIDDPNAAIAGISLLREAGVGISIDDYGAGLSSLSYLKRIAADELKLDRSLVSELAVSTRDRLILKSTIDLAHSLSMSVVAEGVEDEATRALVAAMGCDCVQGYLISRALPIEEFIKFCTAGANEAISTAGGRVAQAD